MKTKLNKKQLAIIIAVAVFVLAVILPTGIYCIVNRETPIQAAKDVFVKDEEQLIGKWQGELAVSGYEFHEDGTYESYISTFSFTGTYYTKGNVLKLINSSSNSSVSYRYSIKKDKLHLVLIDENGEDPSDNEKHDFTRVDHFNLKTPTEALDELADQVKDNED